MPQQRATWGLKKLFGELFRSRKAAPRSAGRRLAIEELEDRCLLSGSPLGTIGGTLFVNSFGIGSFVAGETALPGVAVTLSGTSSQGTAVNVTATTDANGNYTFQDVPTGNYHVTSAAAPGTLGGGNTPNVSVAAGQSLTQNIPSPGMAPQNISLRQFLSSTTSADFPNLLGAPGSGLAFASTPPIDTTPFLTLAIANVGVSAGTVSTTLDLAKNFGGADITTSTVRFNTTDGALNLTLFDAQAPQTVANFYDYINSGGFTNTIFSRLVSGFILQGGALQVPSSGTGLQLTPKGPMVDNEFGQSNTAGTIAMALSPGQPNSATDEFFFNLVNNNASGTTNLDAQKFTVFGALADSASMAVLTKLASTPSTSLQDESATTFGKATPVDLTHLPLFNYTGGTSFPAGATPSNFLTISNIQVVNRPDFLTYSVIGNSNPGLVTPTVKSEHLTLAYTTGKTGSAVVTVRAMNQFGQFVDTSFTVTVT